jgi:hypothetical protein
MDEFDPRKLPWQWRSGDRGLMIRKTADENPPFEEPGGTKGGATPPAGYFMGRVILVNRLSAVIPICAVMYRAIRCCDGPRTPCGIDHEAQSPACQKLDANSIR